MKYLIYIPSGWGGVSYVMRGLKFGLESNNSDVYAFSKFFDLLTPGMIKLMLSRDTKFLLTLHYGLLAILFGRRSIYIVHGSPRNDDRKFLHYSKILWSHRLFSIICKDCYAVSQFTKYINSRTLYTRITGILPNGIIDHKLFHSLKSIRSRKIVFAGSFYPCKRVLDLIEGYKIYRAQGGDYELTLYGEGPQKNKIEKLLENSIGIQYKGLLQQDELLEELSDTAVFVSLNEGEAFGVVLLQALIIGCVLVAPTSGGHLDFALEAVENCVFIDDASCHIKIANAISAATKVVPNYAVSSKLHEKYKYESIVKFLSR